MGTWSAGSFGNDSAVDFACRLTGTQDLTQALKGLGPKNNRISSDLATEAIAASEVIAALLGRACIDMPDGVFDKLTSFEMPSDALVGAATKAIAHIRDNSELADLWMESGNTEWIGVVDDLLARLDLNNPYVTPANDIQEFDESFIESIGEACEFCGSDIEEAEAITLVVESDENDIVWFSSTTFAHPACIEQNLEPPHFNPDGTPHSTVLAQLRRQIAGE